MVRAGKLNPQDGIILFRPFLNRHSVFAICGICLNFFGFDETQLLEIMPYFLTYKLCRLTCTSL